MQSADLIGALTGCTYFVLVAAVFVLRLAHKYQAARTVGLFSGLVAIPLLYLLYTAFKIGRPPIYFAWLVLMVAFVVFEFVADGVLRLDIRHSRWITISYVVFFFAATGGMIGVAAQAGRAWTAAASGTFFLMAALAFVQRARTGQ